MFQKTAGSFRTLLDKAGIPYARYASPGTEHAWLTGRRREFAPRLFK